MESNLRTNHQSNNVSTNASPSGGSNLEEETAKGRELLSAGAEIIAQALSTDSSAFLQASRQSGGQ